MTTSSASQPACRIVIADDQEAYRAMLRLVLGLEPDFEIVGEARDGVAAIEVARQVQPDVLLLDITMPNMSGVEALPNIIEASPNTRVIMLSGVTNASVRARSLAGGAFRYLEKGLNPDEIASAVRAAHGNPSSR